MIFISTSIFFRNALFLTFIFQMCSIHAQTVKDSTKLSLWATYYYTPSYSHDSTGIHLLNKNEDTLGLQLDSCDWCQAAIEGAVIITKDNKTYLFNYAGRSDSLQFNCQLCKKYKSYKNYLKTGKVLWSKSKGVGKGVKNYDLVPYKTIAVDPNKIPYGSVVYIPLAKGVKYINLKGDSVTHNGYFFAGDTGSGIKKNHIDVFVGPHTNHPFSFIKSKASGTFDAYIVTNSSMSKKLLKAHQ